MKAQIKSMAIEAAVKSGADHDDTSWLDQLDHVTVKVTKHPSAVEQMTRYEWNDGSAIVDSYGVWAHGIHQHWLRDVAVMHALTVEQRWKHRIEFFVDNGSGAMPLHWTGPKIVATIIRMTDSWESALGVAGWSRTRDPIEDAERIVGATGDLFDVIQLAQHHANNSLVCFTVQTVNDIHIVHPKSA